MDLTIKRPRWIRNNDKSMLLRPSDNKMCCLGFYALACGHLEEEIIGVIAPRCVRDWRGYGRGDELIYDNLMDANDLPDFSDDDREQKIVELFKQIDVNVTFVN